MRILISITADPLKLQSAENGVFQIALPPNLHEIDVLVPSPLIRRGTGGNTIIGSQKTQPIY